MNPDNHNLITLQQVVINMDPIPNKDEALANSSLIDPAFAERIYDEMKQDQEAFRDNFRSLAATVFFLEDCLMEEIED